VSSTTEPGWLLRQLPVLMQQDDFTARFLRIFEEVAAGLIHSVDTIGVAADLSLAPDEFVPWLGSWIAAPADPEAGRHPLRERDWTRAQTRALGARGTKAGLEQVLTVLSGGHPVEIEDGGGIYRAGQCPEGETGWARVTMPLPGGADPDSVERLIRAEVPIGVEVELVVTSLVPRPRPPEDDLEDAEWESVPGGPYFWDGGREDVLPPLREETGAPGEAEEPSLSGAVQRLPGTAGKAVRAGRICPACAEPNAFGPATRLRCASALRLRRPAPQPDPGPEVLPLWEDDDSWLPERRLWPVVLLVIGLILALTGIVSAFYLLG
jgi:phage tail-like protein